MENENNINYASCATCRIILPLSKFDIKKSGKLYKQCKNCCTKDNIYRSTLKCEHNRKKNYCRLCEGTSFCEHDKIRSKCKSCKGGSICEHNRERYACRECSESLLCEHNCRRSYCRICSESEFCIHDRHKTTCKICDFKSWLRRNIVGRMYKVLGYSDFDYLCCDIDEFIEHIENQFEGDMSWSTYGITFELDHITIKR